MEQKRMLHDQTGSGQGIYNTAWRKDRKKMLQTISMFPRFGFPIRLAEMLYNNQTSEKFQLVASELEQIYLNLKKINQRNSNGYTYILGPAI